MGTKGLFKKAVNLLILSSFLLWNLAVAVPEGGTVAQGSASISQGGSTTTINQTSQNTVINWHGFDTAATESVKFTQPNASSIALNRINSGAPTNFNGSLSANGQVWILNPSGVLFGASSKVDVAGLLVTTHNITDSNFMSGNYLFNPVPGFENSKIINNGLISIKDSGMVALVGPGVENNGIITANLGKVYLSSGSAFVLDLYGDNLINFGTSPAVQNGYVSNSGLIQAVGGKVHMTANAAAGVLDNVISMSGTIVATTASTGAHGQIILNGGHSGTVKVSGKLNASNGGSIETSGNNVVIDSPEDINAGVGGSWTLDPPVIYTSTWDNTSLGNLISYQLNNGTDVSLSTGVSGLGAGDIFVDSPISWSTSAVLTLGAYRDINISAPVTATADGGFLARADLSANGTGTVNFSLSGSVTVNGANGYAKLFYNPAGGNYATPTNYTGFLLGTAPIKVAYMMINTQADLIAAGAVGSTSIVFSYALNNDIDMTGVPLSSAIFNSNFGNNFKGDFEGHNYADGLNKTISNITLSTGGGGVGSLMTYFDGRIDNLTLSNLSLTAGGNYGGLVWSNNGTISNVHVSGNLVGTAFSGGGGITGENQGVIQNSWFSGTNNSGANLYIGGITGYLNTGASIINSYNEGAITGSSAGGIVGLMIGVSTITNVYNVGAIGGGGSAALIGAADIAGSTLTGMYWDTTTSGVGSAYNGTQAASYVGTDTPYNDAQMKVAASFTTNVPPNVPPFDFANTWTTNFDSTYPQLIQNSMDIGITQIAGTVDPSAGGNKVGVFADNVLIGFASVDSNGVFHAEFPPDSVYASNPNIIFAFDQTSAFGDYVAKLKGPVGNLNLVNNTVIVRSDTGSAVLNSEVAAQVIADLYTGSGSDVILNPGVNFLTTAGVVYSPVFTTTNTAYNFDGSIFQTATPSNDVTFNGPVTVTLIGNPAFINNGGNTVFNSTVDGPNDLFINSTGTVTFNDVVGVTTNSLDFLNVTSAQTDINASQIFTVQGANFNSPVFINSGGPITFTGNTIGFFGAVESTGIALQITINGNLTLGDVTVGASSDIASLFVSGNSQIYTDLLKTSGNIIFAGTVDLTGDSVITSTAGSITFGDQVSGAGCGFAWGLTVTTTSGLGTTTFEGDIGLPIFALDGMMSFLTVNGTALIDGATIIQTDGDQTYGDTITLNNSVTMKTLIDGDIQFNGGGAVDPGITLSLYSADVASGPTGLGITGTVNVDNLIVGGPGGANLSLNYPITESFVGGPTGGAGQAIQNTVIDPLADFRFAGAIYCVNGFCAPAVFPSNNPDNIPRTEFFNPPVVTNCDVGGCSNLFVIMDNLSQTGTVSCIHGFVEARNTNGQVRILMLGDPIYAGDTLSANEASSVCVKSVGTNKNECISPSMSRTMEESAYLPGSRIA